MQTRRSREHSARRSEALGGPAVRRQVQRPPIREDDPPPPISPLPVQTPIQRPGQVGAAPARRKRPAQREPDTAEITAGTTQPPIHRNGAHRGTAAAAPSQPKSTRGPAR